MKAANRLINKRASSNAFDEEDDRDGQSRDSRSRISNFSRRRCEKFFANASRERANARARAHARDYCHARSRSDRLDAIVASRPHVYTRCGGPRWPQVASRGILRTDSTNSPLLTRLRAPAAASLSDVHASSFLRGRSRLAPYALRVMMQSGQRARERGWTSAEGWCDSTRGKAPLDGGDDNDNDGNGCRDSLRTSCPSSVSTTPERDGHSAAHGSDATGRTRKPVPISPATLKFKFRRP